MLKLAKLFSTGMVLQREKQVRVWGEAEPDVDVRVTIQGQNAETRADAQGHFMLELSPLEASENETLVVQAGTEKLEITDVAVGEVYIAGGQSNMEFPLRYEKYREEALQTKDTQLRFFDTPKKYYDAQDTDFDYSAVGHWRKADSEENLGYFSAVAFYFAKELREELHVPVGIVGCNWGGTRSCAWMNGETVEKEGKPWVLEWEKAIAGRDMDAFWASRKDDLQNPLTNAGNPCTSPFDAFILPGTPSLEEIGKAMMEMANATMREVGLTEEAKPSDFMQKAVEQFGDKLDARIKPGILYEHMVKKIAPFSIRGVLWYQGESDDVAGLQPLYADMMKGLIGDWRSLWQDETMPFIEVQLPGWYDWMGEVNMDYASIRRCQEQVAEDVEHVYMASISDAGEEHDVHPKDKRIVGHRMALLARHYIYGEELLCEAPRPTGISRQGAEIRIEMAYAQDGLRIIGETLEAMELRAGDSTMAYQASVEGNTLVLKLEQPTEESILIRFAREAWYQVNLVNSAGVPAIPFETRC